MKPADHIRVVLIASIALAAAGQTGKAEAVTAAVAKACARSLAKAFPLRKPGNPAAGSAAGNAEDQRQFYAKCVANGGPTSDSNTKVGK